MTLTNWLLLAILLTLIVDVTLRYAILRVVKPKAITIVQDFRMKEECAVPSNARPPMKNEYFG